MSNVHPTTEYANKILNGDILACKYVKLACQRHLNDLKRDDIYFNEEMANRAILFFDFLHHIKGTWARRTKKYPTGQTIKLELWQKFVTGSIFGWYRKDDTDKRRFDTIYLECPRKNAKSTMGAGWSGYCFALDNEQGAEVYTIGTKREQAKIVFDVFKAMVEKSDMLSGLITVYKHNLHISSSYSKFEALASDAKTLDGLNVSCAVCDEVHEWRNPELWGVIETATGARLNPLQIGITTAGWDRDSLCYNLHEQVVRMLESKDPTYDDSLFGIIYTIDKDDDWKDEKSWEKANPNYGISVDTDKLRNKAKRAKEMPSFMNEFLRKHLNVWTQQLDRWIDPELWGKNGKGNIYVLE